MSKKCAVLGLLLFCLAGCKKDIPVTSISLSESAVTLSVACAPEVQVTAAVEPLDATLQEVVFTSSDPLVAQVDENGRITAVSAGTAAITSSASDDSGVSASMTVTVLPDSEQITVERTDLSFFPGEGCHLDAVLYPLNAYDWSIVYTSSDEAVVSVDQSGQICALAPGTAAITVSPGDGNCQSVTVAVEVKEPIEDGFALIDGDLYYYQSNYAVTDTTIGVWTFGPDGRYTCGDAELDGTIRQLIMTETDDSMSLTERFETLYSWVMANFKYLRRDYVDKGASGWEARWAKAALESNRGNCFSYAAAVTMIARHLGFEAYGRSGNCTTHPGNNPKHGWTEVILDGVTYICDAEMEGVFSVNRKLGWDLFMEEKDTTPTKCPEIPKQTPDPCLHRPAIRNKCEETRYDCK